MTGCLRKASCWALLCCRVETRRYRWGARAHASYSPPRFGDFKLTTALPPTQNSFYSQLYKQKKSERFFKVFYDRMRLAQQEIRATVSVNMFELSCRKRDDDSDASNVRFKKGTAEWWCILTFLYLIYWMITNSRWLLGVSPKCGQKTFVTSAVWNMQQTTVSKCQNGAESTKAEFISNESSL